MPEHLTPATRAADWDRILQRHPAAHLLQSWPWGELKSRFGWRAVRLTDPDSGAAAQVLFRTLPLGLTIAYLPKGPLLDWDRPGQVAQFIQGLHHVARRQGAIFLKVEPDCPADRAPDLPALGFVPADAIQPRRTSLLSIAGPEAEILARMKQKTRYNLRLAQRRGVTVREGAAGDLDTFHALNQITARRDGFAVHSREYYRAAFELFPPAQRALLIAEFEGRALAALMVFAQSGRAYYLYGASSDDERQRMPAYLLQWEAICWARRQGCATYDLWGIPDADEATLEADFTRRQDGLWGVYRFKRGFGGEIVRSAGGFDYVYKPALYRAYALVTRRGAE